MMTAGEYTPAAVKAAPKRAPDAIERKVLVSMLPITFFDELKSDLRCFNVVLCGVVLSPISLPRHPRPE
jgi:hypothetical protein